METKESQPFNWHYGELDDRNFQIHGHTLFFIIVLFSIVIVVVLVFLSAKWVCRHHSLRFPTSSHAPRSSPLPEPQGLDPVIIKGLPIILHQTSSSDTNRCNSEQAECCICLGLFEDGEKVKILPKCSHCYHPECVDRWLCAHSSCPLCRASLRVDSDLPEIEIEIVLQ